jgi:hypothetical protein
MRETVEGKSYIEYLNAKCEKTRRGSMLNLVVVDSAAEV